MGDLLSSASLLVAIITVLYSLWYPAIQATLNAPIPDYKAQCKKPISEVTTVFWKRAVPLAVAAFAIALVFAKDAVYLCINSFTSYYNTGIIKALETYNAVGTAFVLVVILSLALAIYMVTDCRDLLSKRRKLSSH